MRRTPLLGIAIVALALVACDQRLIPLTAGLAGTTTSGSTGGNIPPLLLTPSDMQLIVGTNAPIFTNAPGTLALSLQWRSDRPNVVAVSPEGLVTAIAVGSAIVTARYSFDTTNFAFAHIVVNGVITPR